MRSILVALTLALIFGSGVAQAQRTATSTAAAAAVVPVTTLRPVLRPTAVRLWPDATADVTFTLARGEQVVVRDCNAGWCAIGRLAQMRYVLERDLGPGLPYPEVRRPSLRPRGLPQSRFRPLPGLTRTLPDGLRS